MIIDIRKLKEIAEIDFGDIVEDVIILDINELRIILIDSSFVDVWHSLKLKGRYSYHWERKHIDEVIYRHDNAPHKKWQYVKTFPKHFHNGEEEEDVLESRINVAPEDGLREFLLFVRKKLIKEKFRTFSVYRRYDLLLKQDSMMKMLCQ